MRRFFTRAKDTNNPTDSVVDESAGRPSNLKVIPASTSDIRDIISVWYAAFTSPRLRRMFPDTPGVRKWWEDGIREDILRKPQQTYLKVIDTNAHGRMVAYAKWDLGSMEERGPRALPFDREEMDREACGEFYAHMDRERKRLMGDRKHYFLDMLATHPDYQGQGAGSMLVRWGCALADKDGVPAYVDASKAGKPLYEKFGFVDRSETQRQGEGIEVAMVRETGHNHSG